MTSSTLSLVEVASQRVHPLRDRARIGRGTDADIRLDDPMVALTHAELIGHGDGTVTVRDLGSRHGTFVGSRRIEQAMLRDGDELLIGRSRCGWRSARRPAMATSCAACARWSS
jgi:pSer/pThr/pTyr-binding forkhead associated (FHA) protein